MIESPHNEKLKLVRKLRERKHREREGAFLSEGEDLVEAGLAAGAEPRFLLTAAGSGLGGEEVEPELLASVSEPRLGHAGDRGLAAALGRARRPRPASTCTASPTPATSARSSAPRTRCSAARVVLGPGCADPFSPKAVRASMGSIFAQPVARASRRARRRRRGRRWSPTAVSRLGSLEGAATLCLGAEREGLPEEVLAACEARVTIPLRAGRRRVAQRRRRGRNLRRADIVARHAGGRPDA